MALSIPRYNVNLESQLANVNKSPVGIRGIFNAGVLKLKCII
jgi:hypothetical protein